MHKLDRNAVPVPGCLQQNLVGRSFSTLHSPEKTEIRNTLLTIQKQRCAYCERRTGTERDDGHIEHFKDQAHHGHLTLDWTNLFWSCTDEKTCGKHKDKCNRPVGTGSQALFDIGDLIAPDVDDPHDYLLFVVDGTVRPKNGLSAAHERRALETIRVFQLSDSPFLRKSREDAVRPYIGAVDALLAAGKDILLEYIRTEAARIHEAPFFSVIHQYLDGL
jgi:uncharacterized protein (TIGR02646 family)